MTVSLSLLAGSGWQFFDNSGDVLTGGLLYSYVAGTTTPAATYTSVTGLTANSNPIVLDAAGRVPGQIWLTDGTGYKFRLENAAGTQIGTWDNITSQNTASTGLSATAISYVAAGSSTQRTVQLKLQESVSVQDFGVTGDGSDETTKLQAAFSALNTGVRLSLNGLTVTVSNPMTVSSKSNFVIDGEGGTIVAINGMAVSSNKGLIELTNCEKFVVQNLTFNGNRANRTPAEVYAHSVTIVACRKFIFENVYSNNAVCDGYYFGATSNTNTATYCLDFQMIGCYADNCYRQGASVINAWDFQFIGGAFTNTNGTAPQAGIDVESNAGPTSLGNARGLFQGVRFDGNSGSGLLLSNAGGAQDFVVDACYFSANGAGGVLTYADLTNVRSCSFRNHSAAPGGAVGGVLTFSNSASIRGGSAVGNSFGSNTAAIACIFTGAGPKNIRIANNNIIDHVNVGIASSGNNNVIDGNSIIACGGNGVNITAGSDCVVSNNTINAATGRGIYAAGSRHRIVNNKISNIATVSGGYIQSAGSDALIVGNVLSSDSAVSDIGVRVDSTALAVSGNICVNLNSTDSFSFITSSADDMFYNNVGGSANDRRRVRAGMAVPSFTTAARPAASAVALGQCIFNTTTNKPNWSDGSANWYNADGTTA